MLPDMSDTTPSVEDLASQCTYRCVVPPDSELGKGFVLFLMSQCTYRCVALPDMRPTASSATRRPSLNAPTGAWRSLTPPTPDVKTTADASQCTYRCVVLPDQPRRNPPVPAASLNAPTGAWCSLTPFFYRKKEVVCLNAPTGAWCSLTPTLESGGMTPLRGPGAPPAPGAPLRTGQHRAQSST